jgi:hypothetical protein
VTEIGLLIVAVLAVMLAAVMSAVAWRLHREERRRSEVRVAALAADIHRSDSVNDPVVVGRSASPRLQSNPNLFQSEPPVRSGSRLASVLALGTLAVLSALAVIVAAGRTGRSATSLSEPTALLTEPSVPALSSRSAPLDLVALGQDRDDDRITVHGVVRNPSGRGIDHLAAVVLLFNRRGEFIGTGRAPLEPPALASGAQAAFHVTVANARDVIRYRIRFHRDDQVVPHVDRRTRGPAANTN